MNRKTVLVYVILSEVMFVILSAISIYALSNHMHGFFHHYVGSSESLSVYVPNGIIEAFYSEGRGAIIVIGIIIISFFEIILMFMTKRLNPSELFVFHIGVIIFQLLGLLITFAMAWYLVARSFSVSHSTHVPYSFSVWKIFLFSWVIPIIGIILLSILNRGELKDNNLSAIKN